ncbi:hypothetical protein DFP72DRAFT_370669 [Ephemerocybe angulata]|uniref:Uncharacterized protein n=1 Tax=Ephemerocybe angulata TaxID=980116 RepID=A0A8H6M4K4_9AGAR|nr:hypothetical protein DFP72DRAFT_370669 [Tulosesus angulatus]
MSSENVLAAAGTPPPQRSKSRLVRLLTTRKPRDTSPPSGSTSKPPGVTSAYSKEQRDAALRARGLLPPLSLSQQERQLDTRIPVVKVQPTVEEEGKVSAADLIKQQWEAKNKEREEEQRKRLEQFKFGPSSRETSPTEPKEPKIEPGSVSSTQPEPIPKPTKASRRHGLHQASLSTPMLLGAQSLKDLDHKRERSLQTKTKDLPVLPPGEGSPVTSLLDLPTEFQSYLNAPSSPTTEQSSLPATRPPTNEAETSAPPTEPKSGPSLGLVNARPAPSDSIPRAESSSSVHTPSLDSGSSTGKSSDSLGHPKSNKPSDSVRPVIMESPMEDGAHEAQSESVLHDLLDDKESYPDYLGSDDDKDSGPPVPPRETRVKIVPTPLKSPTDQGGASPAKPVKRKNQSISKFATIGRSVVGTVMRKDRNGPKSPDAVTSPDRAQDRSVSPPLSPKRPSRQATQAPVVVRQAVNPVYYSGGDIQEQAATIKDEEERRMAEMAFLC